jgi:hypothetical protein
VLAHEWASAGAHLALAFQDRRVVTLPGPGQFHLVSVVQRAAQRRGGTAAPRWRAASTSSAGSGANSATSAANAAALPLSASGFAWCDVRNAAIFSVLGLNNLPQSRVRRAQLHRIRVRRDISHKLCVSTAGGQ